MMRILGATLLGLSLATSAAVLSRPASAENFQQRLEQGAQALLGQSPDQNRYQDQYQQDRERNAYEQGRRDEQRRQHADRYDNGRKYGDRGYDNRGYDNRDGDNGIGRYAGRNDGDRYYDRQPLQDQNWGQRRYPERNNSYDNQ